MFCARKRPPSIHLPSDDSERQRPVKTKFGGISPRGNSLYPESMMSTVGGAHMKPGLYSLPIIILLLDRTFSGSVFRSVFFARVAWTCAKHERSSCVDIRRRRRSLFAVRFRSNEHQLHEKTPDIFFFFPDVIQRPKGERNS